MRAQRMNMNRAGELAHPLAIRFIGQRVPGVEARGGHCAGLIDAVYAELVAAFHRNANKRFGGVHVEMTRA